MNTGCYETRNLIYLTSQSMSFECPILLVDLFDFYRSIAASIIKDTAYCNFA